MRKTISTGWLPGLLLMMLLAPISPLDAQTTQTQPAPSPPRSSPPPAYNSRDEGELIELEEVQIHGEIAQPNVAITVARQEPMFREIALERTPAEGLTNVDLSGLSMKTPPIVKMRDWREMLERPRQ
jgi:hypothetical protein